VTLPSTNPSSSHSNISPRQLEVAFAPEYSPSPNNREKELSDRLEQAKSEIARLNNAHKMETTRLKETHASYVREKELGLSSELDSAKSEIARLKEAHLQETSKLREAHLQEISKLRDTHTQEASRLREAHTANDQRDEVKSLSSQLDKKITELARVKEFQSRDAVLLQEYEQKIKQYQHRLKEVEVERDNEKRDRIQGGISLRSEIESAVAKARSEMASEIETLKKELSVSESSYQQILRAIDEEKEELSKSHDSKLRDLMDDNSRLRRKLKEVNESKEQESSEEVAALKEQLKKVTQENGLLKFDNRNLRVEKEKLADEVTTLKKQLDEKSTKCLNERSNEAALTEKLRKAELELDSEKRRRAILEASLDRDERTQVQMQIPPMPGYPMFGYPPMNMGMPMSYGPSSSDKNDKKAKLLEVDLAAERENREALEKAVTELTAALEQEKDALQTQRESLVSTHEREMNEVFVELKKKEDDVTELQEIASQFHDVVEELGSTKELLAEKSKLAEAYEHEHTLLIEVRAELSDAKKTVATLKADLSKEHLCLEQKIQEYNDLLDQHERMKKLHDDVASYYESEIEKLKKSKDQCSKDLEATIASIEETKFEHGREVMRLEEEMTNAQSAHRQEIESIKAELDDLAWLKSKELSESQSQLECTLEELRHVHCTKEAVEQEIRELKQLVEDKDQELLRLLASNEALGTDIYGLRALSDKSGEEYNQATETIKTLTMENSTLQIEMDRLQGKLSDLQQENTVYEDQFADLEKLLDQLDSKLITAEAELQEKEAALKSAQENLAVTERDLDARARDAEIIYAKYADIKTSFDRTLTTIIQKFQGLLPEADSSDADSLEEKKVWATTLAAMISKLLKDKDQQIEEVNFEMSNALRELDTLESKYKQTRIDLAASVEACRDEQELEQDYDELMRYCADLENTAAENRDLSEQVRKLQCERKSQHDEIAGLKEAIEQHVEALKQTEEQRDVFQSRLKEAVDDLEELEIERNELRHDLHKTYTESAKLESS
jgi:chromosome segregation ATPase